MKYFLLFSIVVAVLALFKSHDEFKGGRGGGGNIRLRYGGGGYHGIRSGPITIVDAVATVILLSWIFYDLN